MESLVICSPKLTQKENCRFSTDFLIYDRKISFALLEEKPHKYLSGKLPKEHLLVCVKAFSCNYRDKSFTLSIDEKCQQNQSSGILSYSAFGSEFVGEIIRMGEDVPDFQLGDRVIPDGAYPKKVNEMFGGLPTNHASQRLHLFHWAELIKVPDEMPDEVAASFTIAGQTSFSMIRKLNIQPKDKILVTAPTSNTSLAVLSALSALKVDVYACSSSKSNKEKLKNLNIKDVFQTKDFSDKNINLPYFNAVIDPFHDLYFCSVIERVAYDGKYVSCGMYRQNPIFKDAEIVNNKHLFQILRHCLGRNISIIGNCLGTREDLETAIKSYQKGKFKILVDSTYSDKDIHPFLSKTFHTTPKFGKVVYRYRD